MPPQFSRADVQATARLAHLELSEAELDLFARQLADILAYAVQVQQIDTTGVPPTASVARRGLGEGDREDVVAASLSRQEVLANAPDGVPERGLFRVPRVIG
jgi:aspartyl-tRNA(Asn)/glutamyl-tRNA(Gln) amidotransferase subunit C